MTTNKKVVANRLNARRSSGPRTARGKNNSRRNAVKHGFFSRELILSNSEKAEFETLRCDLRSQLQPTTALQLIALEEVGCCCWRCKLAARLEMRQLTALFDVPANEEPQSEGSIPSTAMTRWFGSGRRELNDGIRILQAFDGAVRTRGGVPGEWKEQLDRAFGVEFYESLVKWPGMSIDGILIAEHLARQRATYGNPGAGREDSAQKVAGDKKSVRTAADDNDSPRVILDPSQNLNMVLKLIEQLTRFLRDLARSSETRGLAGAQAAGATDFPPRYLTTACRDLHRAVDWYAHLKELNL